MIMNLPVSLFFLFLYLQFQTLPSILALSTSVQNNTDILQGVLKEISDRQNWDLEGIRISKLGLSKLRFGTAQRYEFRIRFGKSYLLFKFTDQVTSWNKGSNKDLEDLVREVGSGPLLDTFKLEGPFDLRVSGDDLLSLSLPLNTSHSGLKRILVGEGITLEVSRAHEVSLFHTFDLDFAVNGNSTTNKGKTGFCPFWNSLCLPLLPIHIIGSASLVAYRNWNPEANIDITFISKDIIELLPEKCYTSNAFKNQAHPIHSLNLRIARLETFLRSFLGDRIRQHGLSGFLRVNLKASTVVRFLIEVEKDVGSNETLQDMLEEWRTRPTVERVWFDVMARVEAEKLKPLMVKKVRPFIAVDSASWSNLLSNISFTKFPSVLVPPEALTLDVKW